MVQTSGTRVLQTRNSLNVRIWTFWVSGAILAAVFVIWLALSLVPSSTGVTPRTIYRPADFSDLQGWQADDLFTAFTAFQKSCAKLATLPPRTRVGPSSVPVTAADWQAVCTAAERQEAHNPTSLHRFFEHYMQPVVVTSGGKSRGLFTGYYEPELKASLTCGGKYTVPLYRRPPDLITANLGLFSDDLAGEKLVGQVVDGRFVPYVTRAQVYNGALAGRGLELACADSLVDVFFLEIQGSGRLILDDGGTMQVGYDGKNGHVYRSIGRRLIEMGEIARDKVSLQTIRAWLARHPDRMRSLFETNSSYVFFRPLNTENPIGAQGVELTPGRSLAVDRSVLPLGAPVWLETRMPPLGAAEQGEEFHRLMVAQDTGGAIKGAVRGDVFWGSGLEAEELAGHMAEPGRYFVLLPTAVADRLADKPQSISE